MHDVPYSSEIETICWLVHVKTICIFSALTKKKPVSKFAMAVNGQLPTVTSYQLSICCQLTNNRIHQVQCTYHINYNIIAHLPVFPGSVCTGSLLKSCFPLYTYKSVYSMCMYQGYLKWPH